MGKDAAAGHFETLIRQLEDWYADDVRARAYDGGGVVAAPGHAILRRRRYPGPNWRRLWWEFDGDAVAQGAIIMSLEEEIYGLTHGPSRSGPASGLHPGTDEWRRAIAAHEGSLRAVARRFGVSHTEVRRLRLQFGGAG